MFLNRQLIQLKMKFTRTQLYSCNKYVSKQAYCLFPRARTFCSDVDESKSQSHLTSGDSLRIQRRLKKKLKLDLSVQTNSSKQVNDIVENASVDIPKVAEFPSDVEMQKIRRRQEKHAYRPAIDPESTTILLFPGQGSQFVGMGKKLLAYPGVQELYNKSSEILGYDLLKLCINGPKEKLDSTVFCQPAVFVTSLAAIERLKEEHPLAIERCVGAAGFSVGEYTALVASESLDFESALQVLQLRAEAMQKASEMLAGGMLTVVCDYQTKLQTAMVAAREYCAQKIRIENPVCTIANYLCTDIKVVAGHEEALDFLEKYGKEFGVRRTKRLPVSGAFHTSLMKKGKSLFKFFDALEKLQFKEGKFYVHSNVDAKRYKLEGNGVKGKILLKKHISEPVKWEQILHTLYSRDQGQHFPNTYEVGPGRQLGYLLKMTNNMAFKNYKNIDVEK